MVVTEQIGEIQSRGKNQVEIELESQFLQIKEGAVARTIENMVETGGRMQAVLLDLVREVEASESEKHRLAATLSNLTKETMIKESECYSLNIQRDRLESEAVSFEQLKLELNKQLQRQVKDLACMHDVKEKQERQYHQLVRQKEEDVRHWTQKNTDLTLTLAEKQCEVERLDDRLEELRLDQTL